MTFNYVNPSSYNFTVNSTGTATITFTTSGTCPGTVTKTLILTPAEDPSFTYSTATFCASGSDPSASITTSVVGYLVPLMDLFSQIPLLEPLTCRHLFRVLYGYLYNTRTMFLSYKYNHYHSR